MIPKIIHYCWLSDDPIPEELNGYINGWKQFMPDFKFKLWDKKAFDIYSVKWVEDAYKHKKWAFAADYIRAYALFTEGGIYLDSDVKVLSSLEKYLDCGFFSAIEANPKTWSSVIKHTSKDGHRLPIYKNVQGLGIQAAIIGSEKGHGFPKKLLEYYNSHIFFDGSTFDLTPAPIIYAQLLEEYGLVYRDINQYLSDRIVLYRSNVFADYQSCCLNSKVIHMCAGSWVEKKTTMATKIIKRFLVFRKLYNTIIYSLNLK